MKTKPTIVESILIVFAVIFSSLFYSCDHSYLDIDDIEDYTYSPVVAFPLIYSSLTMDDIIEAYESTSVEVDDDNLVILVYRGQVYSLEASELFAINNQSSDASYTFMPSKHQYGTKDVFNNTFPFIYDGEERVDFIEFRNGMFGIDITADELVLDGYELRFIVSIPSSDDGFGNEFSEEFLLNETPVEFDLTGYSIEFETDGEGNNYFNVDYAIIIETHGQPDNAPYEIEFAQTLNDVLYEELIGYIDNFDFVVGDENINLGIFSEGILSKVFFKDPFIDVLAENSLGIPLDIHFDRFNFYNDESDTVHVEGFAFDDNNPWRISSPANIGESAISSIRFDRDNINLDDLLEISPKTASYDVRGEANPEPDPGDLNFLRHDSQFHIDVDVNLPLWGNVERYVFQDTLDFSLKEIFEDNGEENGEDPGNNIEWMEFKFFIENSFPINLKLQAYFLDHQDQKIDSLFTQEYAELIESALVDYNGDVIEVTFKETIINVTEEKMGNLENAEKILLSFNIRTKQSSSGSSKDNGDPFSVRILDEHYVDVQLGVKAKLSHTIEFDL